MKIRDLSLLIIVALCVIMYVYSRPDPIEQRFDIRFGGIIILAVFACIVSFACHAREEKRIRQGEREEQRMLQEIRERAQNGEYDEYRRWK